MQKHHRYLDPSWQIEGFDALTRKPLATGSGRGLVMLVTHPKGLLLERQYRHGGLRRKLLPRSFRPSGRAENEFTYHQRAFAGGVDTVEPVGWAMHPSGLMGLRFYYFYSRYAAGALPLPQQTVRPVHLKAMAVTLHQLYELGIFHADLNLNNWLILGDRVLLIDFDKAYGHSVNPEDYLKAVLSRMLRSVKKLGMLRMRFTLLRFLVLTARQFGLAPRISAQTVPKRFFTERFWDKCRWKLSGGHQGKVDHPKDTWE